MGRPPPAAQEPGLPDLRQGLPRGSEWGPSPKGVALIPRLPRVPSGTESRGGEEHHLVSRAGQSASPCSADVGGDRNGPTRAPMDPGLRRRVTRLPYLVVRAFAVRVYRPDRLGTERLGCSLARLTPTAGRSRLRLALRSEERSQDRTTFPRAALCPAPPRVMPAWLPLALAVAGPGQRHRPARHHKSGPGRSDRSPRSPRGPDALAVRGHGARDGRGHSARGEGVVGNKGGGSHRSLETAPTPGNSEISEPSCLSSPQTGRWVVVAGNTRAQLSGHRAADGRRTGSTAVGKPHGGRAVS
jgi:hypothetical protein